MTKADHAPSQSALVFKRLSRWYVLAMSVIALVLLASNWLIRLHLDKQLNDSRVINVAGRQRMLSQKLSKEVLLLIESDKPAARSELSQSLASTLALWTQSHQGLLQGDAEKGLPGDNSLAVQAMFERIDPIFTQMVKGTEQILQATSTQSELVDSFLIAAANQVLDNESAFLEGMDALVFQYDKEARAKVVSLKQTESYLLFFAILALILEIAFIFRPAARYVQRNIQQLIQAEKAAQQQTEEMTELYKVKEQSVQELKALNFAVDQAALFASTNLDGRLMYMSEKLMRFLGYEAQKPSGQLAEILSSNEGEQQYIDQIIRTPRSVIWTGELAVTTVQGEKRWLETSIVPVNRSGVQQDYLILCSDITARKQTETELQQVYEEKFEEEFRLQENRSRQVVEAQENERKRIARDMHDGIGQMLTALKFNLESLNPDKPEKAKQKIDGLRQLTSDLIKGVRIATFNLTPPELTDYGIPTALAKLCAELGRMTSENILFENTTDFLDRLDSITETNVYRITQEAVNNAIKYAQASYILVTISHSENMLSIKITDDGIGFDPEQMDVKEISENGSNMGLSFMQERVDFIHGRMFIRSAPGEGTRITMNIPLRQPV
ncbi:MAG: type IV pili methyl-accepting chemotaxis transducer N-terminal domain-containing protein [Bacteroidota bacterium]